MKSHEESFNFSPVVYKIFKIKNFNDNRIVKKTKYKIKNDTKNVKKFNFDL